MENYQITRDQIRKLTDPQAKEWFPEAFEKLEVGKWYRADTGKNKYLLLFSGSHMSPGFMNSKWNESLHFSKYQNQKYAVEATEEEVFEALKNEAVKRGFNNGNYECLDAPHVTTKTKDDYFLEDGELWRGKAGCANCVFKKGKWATIIETITKKEAEKLLNKKIID